MKTRRYAQTTRKIRPIGSTFALNNWSKGEGVKKSTERTYIMREASDGDRPPRCLPDPCHACGRRVVTQPRTLDGTDCYHCASGISPPAALHL